MLNKENNQEATGINNSNVNQAGGNITINNNGVQLADIIPLVDHLVESKLQYYYAQGQLKVEERRKSFGAKLTNSLGNKAADKLYRFNEPSVQYSTRRAALGYIKSGDDEQGEDLIDLLIERINSKELSTEQNLIDKAIDVLPTLSKNSLKLLILLAYRDLSFQGIRSKYIEWLNSINPILDGCENISALDIAYLQQSECTLGLVNLFPHNIYEEEILSKEDLFYRHNITGGQFDEYLRIFGLSESAKGITGYASAEELVAINSVIIANPQERYAQVQICSSQTLEQVLKNPTFENLRDKIHKAIKLGPPFSAEEVKKSLIDINHQWVYALKLLDRGDVITLRPSLLGYYIASRKISKLSGQKISLDIFIDNNQ